MSSSVAFNIKNVSFAYGKKVLFKNLSLTINNTAFCSVVGPNGAGKSTFIKLLAGILEPCSGEIFFNNKPIKRYSRRKLAQNISYVPQESFFSLDFSVLDVVLQGRYPYLKPLQPYQSSDYDMAYVSLRRLEIEHLSKKNINNISSGERQLVIIARSLVQEPSMILLDEPLNYLDLAHQQQVLSLLSNLNGEGMGVVLVVHDLNQAALVSKRMLLLFHGELVEDADSDSLLTSDLVEKYWGIKPLEGRHPQNGKRQIFLPIK